MAATGQSPGLIRPLDDFDIDRANDTAHAVADVRRLAATIGIESSQQWILLRA
jgi:hypothetical protein